MKIKLSYCIYYLLLISGLSKSNDIYVTEHYDIEDTGVSIGQIWNAAYEYQGNRTYIFTTYYDVNAPATNNFGFSSLGQLNEMEFECSAPSNDPPIWGICNGLDTQASLWATGFTLQILYQAPANTKVKIYFALSEEEQNYCQNSENYQPSEDDSNDSYDSKDPYGSEASSNSSEYEYTCYLRTAVQIATPNDTIIISEDITNHILLTYGIIIVPSGSSVKITTQGEPNIFTNDGLFYIEENATLILDNFNLIYTEEQCCPTLNIKVNGGNLIIYNSVFENIHHNNGESFINVSSGNVNIENCQFESLETHYYGEMSSGSVLGTNDDNLNEIKINISSSVFLSNYANKGAVLYFSNNSTIYLRNNSFIENYGNIGGGVIWSVNNKLTIVNSLFERNNAQYGGAIYLEKIQQYQEIDNIYTENFAMMGGAIYNMEGYVESEFGNFTLNLALNSGGAIYNTGQLRLIGSYFLNNQGVMSGNIYSEAVKTFKLTLVTIDFNDNINSFFASGGHFAQVETCSVSQQSNSSNNTLWGCMEHSKCLDQTIGYTCVCPSGTYSVGSFQTLNCIPCGNGTYCPGDDNNSPQLCPLGAYCSASEATVCPVGYYCPSRDTLQPILCNEYIVCPLATIDYPQDQNIEEYLLDLETNQIEYEIDKGAVEYYSSQISHDKYWAEQLSALIWTVVASLLTWFIILFIVKYKQQNITYISLIRDIDFFPTKHRVEVGEYVKSKKTIWGGAITLLWVLCIIFLTWFYGVRFKYNNYIIATDHLTNETIKTTSRLAVNIHLEGGISVENVSQPFQMIVKKGIASSSNIFSSVEYFDYRSADLRLVCENCIFDDYQILINICSNNNETYIRKIGWDIQAPSFRQGEISKSYGIFLPNDDRKEVWKYNGHDLPIINLFLKPIKYINNIDEEESEGFAIEYQERYYGQTRNNCSFIEDSCEQDFEFLEAYYDDTMPNNFPGVISNGALATTNMCSDKSQTGIQILLTRTIGLYKVSVNYKYMAMDMLSELFAMIGACTSTMILMMVMFESYRVLKKKYQNGQALNIFKTLCCAEQCCSRKETHSETKLTSIGENSILKKLNSENNEVIRRYSRNIKMKITETTRHIENTKNTKNIENKYNIKNDTFMCLSGFRQTEV